MTAARPNLKSDLKSEQNLRELEVLVDELIKPNPLESRVAACMQAVGLNYSSDPISRMNEVLNKLNKVRGGSAGSMDQNL